MQPLTYDQVKSIKADIQKLARFQPHKEMLPRQKVAICVLIGVIAYRVAREYDALQPSIDESTTPKSS